MSVRHAGAVEQDRQEGTYALCLPAVGSRVVHHWLISLTVPQHILKILARSCKTCFTASAGQHLLWLEALLQPWPQQRLSLLPVLPQLLLPPLLPPLLQQLLPPWVLLLLWRAPVWPAQLLTRCCPAAVAVAGPEPGPHA